MRELKHTKNIVTQPPLPPKVVGIKVINFVIKAIIKKLSLNSMIPPCGVPLCDARPNLSFLQKQHKANNCYLLKLTPVNK